MQTYGNFFNPPKPENQIVDKWRIAGREKLFNKIYKHVFCAVLVLINYFGQNNILGTVSKCHFTWMFFGLFDLYSVE
ncbi:MAG: hypothetical protein WDM78_16915 [Puia sp.]